MGFNRSMRALPTPSLISVGHSNRWRTPSDGFAPEYVLSSRGPLFDLLKAYLWGDKNSLTLAQIATELDLTEEAVKKALQRLRDRFRDALRTEVAQTVATPDLIDEGFAT